MSSKPTTEIAFGTCRPASWKALIAPNAELSLKANSALNGIFRLQRNALVAGYATSGVDKSPSK